MKLTTKIANECYRDVLIDIAINDDLTGLEKATVMRLVSERLRNMVDHYIYNAGCDLWDTIHEIEEALKDESNR